MLLVPKYSFEIVDTLFKVGVPRLECLQLFRISNQMCCVTVCVLFPQCVYEFMGKLKNMHAQIHLAVFYVLTITYGCANVAMWHTSLSKNNLNFCHHKPKYNASKANISYCKCVGINFG